MESSKNGGQNFFDQINTWPVIFMMASSLFLILLMQSMWNVISGLYFPYSYEAVILPYVTYICVSLYSYSKGIPINKFKQLFLSFAFALLFMPTFFLLMTNQIDMHTAFFGNFDPSLEHMPYACFLPFFFLAVLLVPTEDFLKNDIK